MESRKYVLKYRIGEQLWGSILDPSEGLERDESFSQAAENSACGLRVKYVATGCHDRVCQRSQPGLQLTYHPTRPWSTPFDTPKRDASRDPIE